MSLFSANSQQIDIKSFSAGALGAINTISSTYNRFMTEEVCLTLIKLKLINNYSNN